MEIGTGTEISTAYERLNEEWRKTTSVLLGEELGELRNYEKWLLDLKQPRLKLRSAVSGNEAVFSSPDYSPAAKAVCLDELVNVQSSAQLSSNEIKDIDSLFGALRERFYYCGNIILGNSQFVEKSSSITDSFYVYESARINGSRNIAYTTISKVCENLFGCNVGSFCNYAIRCHQFGRGARLFEAWLTWRSSGCYYTYNLMGCEECFFSFNLRGKRYAIGNRVLPREQYASIKAGLLEQLADIIKQKKSAPSMADIINGCGAPSREEIAQLAAFATFAKPSETHFGMQPIEDAFSKTSKLIFGKPLSGSVCDYAGWLKRHIIDVGEIESVLGSGKIPVPNYENYRVLIKNRYVGITEAEKMGEGLKISEQEAERLNFSNTSEILGPIAYISSQFRDGNVLNVSDSPIVISSSDCHSVLGCVNVKDSAFCTWPNGSEYVFGCAFAFNSKFSMKCYNSVNLTGCFEVDSSSCSTYDYFCHNVENVHDSMFCFNAKNLRYAIGNNIVGMEQYQRAKSMLQIWLIEKLEKNKAVNEDIFNICSVKLSNG